MKIFSGTSNRSLAEKIAANLGTPLGDVQIVRFNDGEIFAKIKETVRGETVFVVQSTSNPVNENLMELLIFIDAVKLQKEPEKKNRVRVTLHYGDEIQSIVEAIADTIDGFGSSSECPVQRNPYPIFLFRRCLSFYPCL